MRTKNAIYFTINHLLNIAFGKNVDVQIVTFENHRCEILMDGKCLVFNFCSQDDFEKLVQGNLKLEQIDAFDNHYQIPILKLNSSEKLYQFIENKLIFNYDVLSLPFALLSCYDEFISKERDEHGRFLFTDSLAYKYDILKKPIVDEYAFLIRKALKDIFSDFSAKERKTQIIPTHDIDDLYRFTGLFKSIKSLLGELYFTKNVSSVVNSTKHFFRTLKSKRNDPYFAGIEQLYNDSQKNGLKSVFFFMGAGASSHDAGQQIDTAVKNIIQKIKNAGMQYGIHPGYFTYQNKNLLKKEINNVESKSGVEIKLSRQHYLRFDIRQTFTNLEECGILEDYTMGFAEEEGFRCGTSYPFHPYNISKDSAYNIIERPLIVMDVTLLNYKKYTIKQAKESIEALYKTTSRLGGDFIILWHNAYVYREPKWYSEVYQNFLKNY